MTKTREDLPVVEGYEVICRIAAGEMANVWLARRLSGDQTPIVLKTILPYLAKDRDFVRLFQEEARLAASLAHHNIIRVFDFGQSNQLWYLATEFVSGCTLRQIQRLLWTRRKAPPPWLVLGVMASVCEALQSAHEHRDADGRLVRVIHGDVTPENIMLSMDGVVKVVDFGLARAATGSYVDSRVTRGKIVYLAPEIADAWSGSTLDARSDVYSVGVILYEALTGVRPYPQSGDLEMLRLIMPDGPTSVRRAARWIPERLSRIVMRAISRDPETRYQSAAELGAAIGEFLDSLGSRPTEQQVAAYLHKLLGPIDAQDSPSPALAAVLRMNALEETLAAVRTPAAELPPDSMASAPPSASWRDEPSVLQQRDGVAPQGATAELAGDVSVEIGDGDMDWDVVFEEDGSEPIEPAPMTRRMWDLSAPAVLDALAQAPIQVPAPSSGRPTDGMVILTASDLDAAQSADLRPGSPGLLHTAELPRFTDNPEASATAAHSDQAPTPIESEKAPDTAQSEQAAEPEPAPAPEQQPQEAEIPEPETSEAPAPEAMAQEAETQEFGGRTRSVWETGNSPFRVARPVDNVWERSIRRSSGELAAERGNTPRWDEITARVREQAASQSDAEQPAPDAEQAQATPAPAEVQQEGEAAPTHSWDRVTRKRKQEHLVEAAESAGAAAARSGGERYEAPMARRDPWDSKTRNNTPQVEAMELFEEGLRLVREGSFADARRLWERGLELDPENRRLETNLRRLEARLDADKAGQRGR